MAINLQRRGAFKQVFKNYPAIVTEFAKRCEIVDPKTGITLAFNKDDEKSIEQVLIAQFALRLLKTRAGKDATPEMAWFCFETADRYNRLRSTLLNGMELTAPVKPRNVILSVEQALADMIIEAFVMEVNHGGPHFEEIDFWRDVFLALLELDRIKYAHPLSTIVLDHMEPLTTALAA